MPDLKKYSDLVINWNLAPEDAVTLYLEWGNNDWHAEHAPVRSKDDFAIYFVVDTWAEKPIVRLVKRNSENVIDLISFDYPEQLLAEFIQEFGKLKGLYEPTENLKIWLKEQLGE